MGKELEAEEVEEEKREDAALLLFSRICFQCFMAIDAAVQSLTRIGCRDSLRCQTGLIGWVQRD